MAVTFDDLHVQGNLTTGGIAKPSDATCATRHFADAAKIKRIKCAQDALERFPIDLTSARVHDNLASLLPGTAAADDCGIVGNAGTSSPYITSGDLNGAGDTLRYCRFITYMPPCYDPFQTVNLIAHAGMESTTADVTAKVDFVVHRCDKRGTTISADLNATVAQFANSATFSDETFSITATDMLPGDMLDIRMLLRVEDDVAGGNVELRCGAVYIECDIRS